MESDSLRSTILNTTSNITLVEVVKRAAENSDCTSFSRIPNGPEVYQEYTHLPSHFFRNTIDLIVGIQQPEIEDIVSICFGKKVSFRFYCKLLRRVLYYTQTFDEGSSAAREQVWNQFYTLMGTPKPESDLVAPLISAWLLNPKINLVELELIYIAFVMSASGDDTVLSGSSSKTTSLFSPFGSSVASALNQLRLLKHWEAKLEKLSMLYRKTVWNMCLQFPTFNNFDSTSFKNTLAEWCADPLKNLNNITILFGVLGYLKEYGFIRSELCYPKTAVPVFQKGAAQSTTPTNPTAEPSQQKPPAFNPPVSPATTPSLPSAPATLPSTPASLPSTPTSLPSAPASLSSSPASLPSSPLKPMQTHLSPVVNSTQSPMAHSVPQMECNTVTITPVQLSQGGMAKTLAGSTSTAIVSPIIGRIPTIPSVEKTAPSHSDTSTLGKRKCCDEARDEELNTIKSKMQISRLLC